MTQTNDLLNSLNTSGDNQTPQDTSTNAPVSDPLSDLVGDGKKFKDAKALAQAKLESDRFIEQLKNENKQMRDSMRELEGKVSKQATLSELMDEVRKASNQGTGSDNQAPVSVEEILKVVDTRVSQREQEKVRTANRAKSNALVLNKFNGDDKAALDFIKKRTEHLGVSGDQLKAMAEQSPEAFATLLGLNTQRESRDAQPSVKGSVNTEAFVLPDSGERNQAYYKNLRKQMGVAKFFQNHALQKQLYKDMDRLGDKFFE